MHRFHVKTIKNTKTINNIVSRFVINTLPTISVDLYYESINEIIQVLNANSVNLPKIMLGRKCRHIGLIMKETMYATLSIITLWGELKYPVTIPTIPEKATVTHPQQANETHDKQLQTY